jgi:hypothetical protein
MILLPFALQQQAATFPQSSPLQDFPAVRDAWRKAYKDFKPSAAVTACIEELKNRDREALNLCGAGEMSQTTLSIEIERNQIHRHLHLCLALVAGEKGTVPDLVVVKANSREIARVFPGGKLPADSLEPNKIYECEPGGKRRVRYLTLYRWDSNGERFAVFAREPEP